MKIHYRIILLIFFVSSTFWQALYAQHIIWGKISDEHNHPVADAVVQLQKDSTILQTVIPDTGGQYTLMTSDLQRTTIRVSCLGYVTKVNTITDTISSDQVIDIRLTAGNKDLEEVTISGNKPLFERKVDRVIFNVSGNITVSGGNALDAVRRSPGVLIRQQEENNITLMGKSSVQVLINDRLLQLTGEDLIAYLQAIPADNIERIEVITAPPAKYDASGNSGLINIVLKKNNRPGVNGNIRLGYEQASYGKGIAGGNVNFRKGSLNIYGNIDYSSGANQITERLNTQYPGQLFKVTDDYKRMLKPLQYTLGADYELHKNGILGVQLVSNIMNRANESNSGIQVLQLPSLLEDSTMRTLGYSTMKNSNNLLNLNYVWTLDTSGAKMTINANRLWFQGKRNNDYSTVNYIDEFTTPTGAGAKNRATGNQQITITNAQADIDLPGKRVSLAFGGKLSFTENESDNLFQYYDQGTYYKDTGISNAFIYSEKVQALYINAQKTIGKWDFQAGLRGEFTQTEGYSRNLNQTNANQYFNIFPTAFVQYQCNEQHVLNLNYSKRVSRPGYRSLDPFRAYTTPYHYSEGNPFLLPSFNHNMELAYTLKSKYTFTAFYQYERNHSGSVWIIDPVNNITSGVSKNFADIITYGFNAMGTFQPFAWWEAQVQLSAQEQQLNSAIYTRTDQSYHLPMYYAGVNNSFRLNKEKTLLAEVNVYYLSKYREEFLEINPIGSADFGFKTLLLHKKLTVNLSVNDLLATQKPKGIHIVTGQTIDNYFDTRNVRLSVNYKFGNKKMKSSRERKTGIEEEKGRAG